MPPKTDLRNHVRRSIHCSGLRDPMLGRSVDRMGSSTSPGTRHISVAPANVCSTKHLSLYQDCIVFRESIASGLPSIGFDESAQETIESQAAFDIDAR